MTIKNFNKITSHIWKMRDYLQHIDKFDYPFYGGLKSRFNGSPEACDAMQNLWMMFCIGSFKSKKSFQAAYKKQLNRLGEKVK